MNAKKKIFNFHIPNNLSSMITLVAGLVGLCIRDVVLPEVGLWPKLSSPDNLPQLVAVMGHTGWRKN